MGEYIRQTPVYERCIKDESKGRLLTGSCVELRALAYTLDKLQGKLYLPVEIAENKVVEMTSEAVKILLLPYLTQKTLKREFLDSMLSMKLNQELMVLVNFFMVRLLAMVKKLNSVTSALAIFSLRYFQSPPSILLQLLFCRNSPTILLQAAVSLNLERLRPLIE